MKEHSYFVYLMASRTHVLYCGMTNNLVRRVAEHKSEKFPGFSQKYSCTRLVWFEHFQYVGNAVEREKQIKNWNRGKKLDRIQEMNPTWVDLSEDWFNQVKSKRSITPLRSIRQEAKVPQPIIGEIPFP